ncbi:hypothetical protein [Hymenobacter glacieicola]|nr:hypothetical protein [Hymenobacter glacieicola]
MQFAIFPRLFKAALQLVQQSAFSLEGAILPAAAGVLVESEGGSLRLTATTLTTSLSTTVPLAGNSTGTMSTVVDARLLTQILGQLPPKQETRFLYAAADELLVITGPKGQFRQGGEASSNFPRPKQLQAFGNRATLPAKALHKALLTIEPCILSSSKISQAYTAGLLRLRGQRAVLQATGGFFAASCEVREVETTAQAELMLPLAAVRLLIAQLGREEVRGEVVVNWNETSAEFSFGHPLVRLSTQLVEDTMPPVDNHLLPDPKRVPVLVDKEVLRLMALRLRPFSTKNQAFFSFADDRISVAVSRPEWGREATEWQPAQVNGPAPELQINLKFLARLLEVLDTQEVELSLPHVSGGVMRLLPGSEAKAPYLYNTTLVLATILPDVVEEMEEAQVEEEF